MWLMQWEVHMLRGVWLESIGMEIWTLKWCSLVSVCAISCHVKSNICAGVCVHNHEIALYSQECCLKLWRIILFFDRRGGLSLCAPFFPHPCHLRHQTISPMYLGLSNKSKYSSPGITVSLCFCLLSKVISAWVRSKPIKHNQCLFCVRLYLNEVCTYLCIWILWWEMSYQTHYGEIICQCQFCTPICQSLEH